MLLSGFLRDDDREDQIHRLVVRRFEIDCFLEPEKTGRGFVQLGDAGMRDRKTWPSPVEPRRSRFNKLLYIDDSESWV